MLEPYGASGGEPEGGWGVLEPYGASGGDWTRLVSGVSWRMLLAEATQRLSAVSESPEIDARRLIERASGHEPAELRFALDAAVTQRQMVFFDGMLDRRSTGEPLQYVLGSWGFRTLDLFLDRRVLIPRPETEIVTEIALAELDRAAIGAASPRPTAPRALDLDRAASPRPTAPRALDLGTGSGAIALSIAVERRAAEVWAVDVSGDALDVARANLAGIGHHARRVRLAHGDWFAPLPSELHGTFDVIVANPPYVADAEVLPEIVRGWEPVAALYSGPTGLECYEVIVPAARAWLHDGGALVLEIGATQAADVRAIATRNGYASIVVHPDLAGRDRVVVIRP